ncbi:MAG: hypothetical protein ACK4SX_04820 [Alcanivoracaceae bacterium]
MIETKPDHAWLLRYDILRQVNQCRRLIQAEFGVKLHLDDSRLRLLLADYAGSSRTKSLQRCYAEMRLLLIDLEGPDLPAPVVVAEPPVVTRMYRGRPVAEPEPPVTAEPGNDDVARPMRTIVYRGRVMQVA